MKLGLRLLYAVFLLSGYGSPVAASPTSNEYLPCHQMAASVLVKCLDENPGRADNSCWDAAQRRNTACYASVQKSHQPDRDKVEAEKAASVLSLPRQMTITVEVVFAPDMMKLSPDEEKKLRGVAHYIVDGAVEEILIEAHANETGTTTEYRMAIAGSRADALKSFLISRGLPAEKISTRASPDITWEAPKTCSGKQSAKRKDTACKNPGSPATVIINVVRKL